MHGQKRDQIADVTQDLEASPAVERAQRRVAVDRAQRHARIAGVREQQRVRERVVETLSTEEPEQDDLLGPALERGLQRELKVGLIFLARELRDLDAFPAVLRRPVAIERVEVADHEIREHAPLVERASAAVGGDDEVRARELRPVVRMHVAVRHDHGLHALNRPSQSRSQPALAESQSSPSAHAIVTTAKTTSAGPIGVSR